MEVLFNAVSLALIAAAITTFVRIVRDVFEHLDKKDRASLSEWARLSSVVNINRALDNAWREHLRLFPRSRKRLLFVALLLTACVSLLGYPLWVALGQQM